MKWFHHECTAKHSPKIAMLLEQFGPEGTGLFWGLLEEIGAHSETFHLKVRQLSEKADRDYDTICRRTDEDGSIAAKFGSDPNRFPAFPVGILASINYVKKARMVKIIDGAVDIGLFDRDKWKEYNILYSASFEMRSHAYTRRLAMNPRSVRRVSE